MIQYGYFEHTRHHKAKKRNEKNAPMNITCLGKNIKTLVDILI